MDIKKLKRVKIQAHYLDGYNHVKAQARKFSGACYFGDMDGRVVAYEQKPIPHTARREIKISHICFTWDDRHGDNWRYMIPISRDGSVSLRVDLMMMWDLLTGRTSYRHANSVTEEELEEIASNARDLREVSRWLRNEPLEVFGCSYTKTRRYRKAGGNSFLYSHDEDKIVNFDGINISTFVSRRLKTCPCCGRMIYQGDEERRDGGYVFKSSGDSRICFECYEELPDCDNCGEKHEFDDEPVGDCRKCRRETERGVHDYGHTLRGGYGFYTLDGEEKVNFSKECPDDKLLYLGLEKEGELEESWDEDDDHEERQYRGREIKRAFREWKLFNTEDSSLNNGFEIHTHPTTYEAFKKLDWGKLINESGLDFHNDTCGLHIHTNRGAWSKLHLWKACRFLFENLTLTTFIADRYDESQFDQYAQFRRDFLQDLKRALRVGRTCFGSKYTAVNFTHGETIEFRFFGGSNSVSRLYEKIEFLKALHEWTRETSLKELSVERFVGYVNKNKRNFNNLASRLSTGAGRTAIANSSRRPDFLNY